MIEITRQQYKQIKNTNAKLYYKQNLQGKDIKNPILGTILFTQLGLGETFHRTKRNLRPFICLLKDIVETGSCDGKLEQLYKSRKDRIVGFYHIKNTVKLAFIIINIDVLIGQDQDGKKYYMFKKDPQGYLGEDLSSHREPSGSNIIINHKQENVNREIEEDFKDLQSGDILWIGDCIKLEIASVNKIEEIMDQDRQAQHHRLTNRKKSDAAKKAWKKHHYSYAKANRRKEREMDNTFFKQFDETIRKALYEAEATRDNVFEKECTISFDNMSGGISMSISKEGNVSLTSSLDETGAGSYKTLNVANDQALQTLYNNIKADLLELCKNFDTELAQIIAKHGLKSTK